MSLSATLSTGTTLDTRTTPRLQIIERHSAAVLEGIAEGTGHSTQCVIDDLVTIMGGQLLNRIEIRFKNKATGTHHRIILEYDWERFNFILHRDGETVEIPIRDGMFLPEIDRHREAIARTLKAICERYSVDHLDFKYVHNPKAVNDRGKDKVRALLKTRPMTPGEVEEEAREYVIKGNSTSLDVSSTMSTTIERIGMRGVS